MTGSWGALEHGIVLAPRKAPFTRAAFQAHYEDTHAPLFYKYAGDTIGRYVRNHVVATYGADTPFDTISEFGLRAEDRPALSARLRAPEAAELEADVHRFLAERGNSFPVEETLVAGPPRAPVPGQAPVRKRALLKGGDGEALARSFADRAARVTLTRWLSDAAPLTAMVMLWPKSGVALDIVGAGLAYEADVDECCTVWTN